MRAVAVAMAESEGTPKGVSVGCVVGLVVAATRVSRRRRHPDLGLDSAELPEKCAEWNIRVGEGSHNGNVARTGWKPVIREERLAPRNTGW
jgi:hypothetical protein